MLQDTHTRVTQPCYDDDAGAGSNFEKILAHFRDLQYWGALQFFFPEQTKSILVVAPRNVAKSEKIFMVVVIKIVTGSRYLGGFIVYREENYTLMAEKVQGW